MHEPRFDSRFRDIEPIGSGSFSKVYRAFDTVRNTTVALKVLPGQGLRESAAREFHLLRINESPYIGHAFDFFPTQDMACYSMEFIEGSPLGQCRDDCLKVASRICQAVEHVHALGIVHNDLKPENILVVDGIPKIIDFGLSSTDMNGRRHGISGSPAYMAPEIFDGGKPTIKSDIYSLGLLLYEYFEGNNPFSDLGIERLITEKKTTDFALKKVPDNLRPVLLSMLSPDPALRPGTPYFIRFRMMDADELRTPFLPFGPSLCSQEKSEIMDMLASNKEPNFVKLVVADEQRFSRMIQELMVEIPRTGGELFELSKPVETAQRLIPRVPGPVADGLQEAMEGEREIFYEKLVALLGEFSRRNPTLLLCHSDCDRKLADMIDRTDSPMLIAGDKGREICVQPLDRQDIREYCRYVLNPLGEVDLLSDNLYGRTAGNLLDVDRQLRDMVISGVISAEEDGWHYRPERVSVEGYNPGRTERTILGALSEAKVPVPESLLASLFDFDEFAVALTGLVKRGLVVDREHGFSTAGYELDSDARERFAAILAESGIDNLIVRAAELYAKNGRHEKCLQICSKILPVLRKSQSYSLARRVFLIRYELGMDVMKNLKMAGLMSRYLCDFGSALKYYDIALRAAQNSGASVDESNVLNDIGVIHFEKGDYSIAEQYYNRSLELATEDFQRVRLLSNIGACNQQLYRLQEAEMAYRKGLDTARSLDNSRILSVVLYNIAVLNMLLYKEEALTELQEALSLSLIDDSKRLAVMCSIKLAAYHRRTGNLHMARDTLTSIDDVSLTTSLRFLKLCEELHLDITSGNLDSVPEKFESIMANTLSVPDEELVELSCLLTIANNLAIADIKRPSFVTELPHSGDIEAVQWWLEQGYPDLAASFYYRYGTYRKMLDANLFPEGLPRSIVILKNGLLHRDANENTIAKEMLLPARYFFGQLGNEPFIRRTEEALSSIERKRHSISGRDTLEILDVINGIVSELEPDRLLPKIMSKMLDITEGERAILFLIDSEGKPILQKAISRDGEMENPRYSRSVIRDVIEKKTPLVRENVVDDDELSVRASVVNLNIKMVLAAPLLDRAGEFSGILYIDSDIGSQSFGSEILLLVEILSKTASIALENSRRFEALRVENISLQSDRKYNDIIGNSPAMKRVLRRMEIVAQEHITVLLSGETGTGKDLIAGTIHRLSRRKDGPFIAINCAAVPENLLESELFGYEKGAFTGATTQKKGKFEMADGGTIFLNEIGEMTVPLQAKLLSFLETNTFQRLGGLSDIHTDVRIIAATNIDMEEAIREGIFRQDLFYRIGRIQIDIPPLRERREDIPELVRYFVSRIAHEFNREIHKIESSVMRELARADWPGNIRQLRNTVEEMVIFADSGIISALPDTAGSTDELALPERYEELKELYHDLERRSIARALDINDWNIKRTAESYGINRTRLHQLINQYNLR